MKNGHQNGADDLLMHKLREILLHEDREALQQLRNELDNPEQLSKKVSPIIDEHINFMKQHFPVEFKNAVNKIVEQKIRDSQQELLNVIYPALGLMIRKYIAHQIQLLKEKIEDQIRRTTNATLIWRKIRTSIFGVSESDLMLASAEKPKVEEVFIIERESGLLKGSASLQPAFNRDVVAGMLTAIKAFVEDAFEKESQELELVQYGTYQIILQNFGTYYIALAVSGLLSAGEKDRLLNAILEFADTEKALLTDNENPELERLLSSSLVEKFIDSEKK
jgi:hypothetical protein